MSKTCSNQIQRKQGMEIKFGVMWLILALHFKGHFNFVYNQTYAAVCPFFPDRHSLPLWLLFPGKTERCFLGFSTECCLDYWLDSLWFAWLDCLMVQTLFSLLVYSTFESSLTSLDSEFRSVIQNSVLSDFCTKPMTNKMTWNALCFYLKLLRLWLLCPKDSLQSACKTYYKSFLMVISLGIGGSFMQATVTWNLFFFRQFQSQCLSRGTRLRPPGLL